MYDALLDSIDRFDKFPFLTNQQQPNIKAGVNVNLNEI